MWDEITHPFPNFNGCTIEVWEWISNFIPLFIGACDYLSVLGLKLICVSKSDAIWHHGCWPILAQVMACHLVGAEPLPEAVLTYYTRASTKLKMGYTGFTSSVRLSVRPDPQNGVLWLLLSINLGAFFPVWLLGFVWLCLYVQTHKTVSFGYFCP